MPHCLHSLLQFFKSWATRLETWRLKDISSYSMGKDVTKTSQQKYERNKVLDRFIFRWLRFLVLLLFAFHLVVFLLPHGLFARLCVSLKITSSLKLFSTFFITNILDSSGLESSLNSEISKCGDTLHLQEFSLIGRGCWWLVTDDDE